MKEHTIKINKIFCDDIIDKKKTFEVRFNDRNYQVGDIIHFLPVDENKRECYHRIVNRVYKITYVLTGWGLQTGYVVLSIQEVQCDPLEDYIC